MRRVLRHCFQAAAALMVEVWQLHSQSQRQLHRLTLRQVEPASAPVFLASLDADRILANGGAQMLGVGMAVVIVVRGCW
jgi:hypothetical protein